MVGIPLRFIHASDLHLELPVHGMDEVPRHMADALVNAPYDAAERLFDMAVSEPVDFVVFSGDVYHPHSGGVRAIDFLLRQCNRLAEHNIEVYWAGGMIDPSGRLPSALTSLRNVHLFPKNKVQEITHSRDGEPIAMLAGMSYFGGHVIRAADFRPDPTGLFSIAIAYGDADPELLEKQGIHYWALGGRHRRQTLFAGKRTAHYAGILQGRSFDTPGKHGCSLVTLDELGSARVNLQPVDVGRLHVEVLELDDDADADKLEELMRQRMQSLTDAAGDRFTLIWWTVINSGRIAQQLRYGSLARELTHRLREDFGYGTPFAWTVAVVSELRDTWTGPVDERNTLRGDYLNLVQQYRLTVDDQLDLKQFLSERFLEGALGEAVARLDEAHRRRTLDDAAFLGAGLLRGEKTDAPDSHKTDST